MYLVATRKSLAETEDCEFIIAEQKLYKLEQQLHDCDKKLKINCDRQVQDCEQKLKLATDKFKICL